MHSYNQRTPYGAFICAPHFQREKQTFFEKVVLIMTSDDGFSDNALINGEEVSILGGLPNDEKVDIDADEMIMSILSPEGVSREDTTIINKKAMYLSINRLNCNDGSSSDEEGSFDKHAINNEADKQIIEPEELEQEEEAESLSNNYTSLVNCNDCDEEFGDFLESIPNVASIKSDFDDNNDDEQFADFESNDAATSINIPPPANLSSFVSIPPLSVGNQLHLLIVYCFYMGALCNLP